MRKMLVLLAAVLVSGFVLAEQMEGIGVFAGKVGGFCRLESTPRMSLGRFDGKTVMGKDLGDIVLGDTVKVVAEGSPNVKGMFIVRKLISIEKK